MFFIVETIKSTNKFDDKIDCLLKTWTGPIDSIKSEEMLVTEADYGTIGCRISKGQLISKENYVVLDSSKKRTKDFCPSTKRVAKSKK